MRSLLYLVLILFLVSCGGNKVHIAVINKSGSVLESCYIRPSTVKQFVQFENIKPGEQVSGEIDLSDSKGDGDFTILYAGADPMPVKKRFGYFTGGAKFDYNITIENSGLKIEEMAR